MVLRYECVLGGCFCSSLHSFLVQSMLVDDADEVSSAFGGVDDEEDASDTPAGFQQGERQVFEFSQVLFLTLCLI